MGKFSLKGFGNRLKGVAEARWAGIFPKGFPIYRTLHIIWIGDENKRPENCIETWRKKNTDWTVRVWGNQELLSLNWMNHRHMSQMLTRGQLAGVADMMRWEILEQYGGFAIDADAICIRQLENWLFEPNLFACWENEIARPGLIANGYVYSHPGNPFIQQVISDIHDLPNMDRGLAWELTGPQRITDTFRNIAYTNLTIYPSHYFLPTHFTGVRYAGDGPVFAEQLWGTTRNFYADLATKSVSKLGSHRRNTLVDRRSWPKR